jgi:hypothetical protein
VELQPVRQKRDDRRAVNFWIDVSEREVKASDSKGDASDVEAVCAPIRGRLLDPMRGVAG